MGSVYTLNSGDVAKVIGSSKTKGDIYVNDGDGDIEFSHTLESGLPQMIVGPCTVKLAYHDQNAGYVSSTTFAIKRASDTGSTEHLEWELTIANLPITTTITPLLFLTPTVLNMISYWGGVITDTPWNSYTNGSWYYMHSMQDGSMFGMPTYQVTGG